MILSYSLSNDISCEKLCKDIGKVITKLSKSGTDISSFQLVIDIRSVTDSETSLLPKLECKNS